LVAQIPHPLIAGMKNKNRESHRFVDINFEDLILTDLAFPLLWNIIIHWLIYKLVILVTTGLISELLYPTGFTAKHCFNI